MMFRTLAAFALIAVVAFAGDPPKAPSEKDAKAKVDAIKAAKDNDAKKKAIADAGKCPHATVAAALESVVIDGTDEGVRAAAIDALGEMKGLDAAAKSLVNVLNIWMSQENAILLSGVFRAMGKVGSATSVPGLKEYGTKHLPGKGDKAPSDLTIACVDALVALKFKASFEALLEIDHVLCTNENFKVAAFQTLHVKVTAGLKLLLPAIPKELGGDEVGVWWSKNKATYNEDLTVKK